MTRKIATVLAALAALALAFSTTSCCESCAAKKKAAAAAHGR